MARYTVECDSCSKEMDFHTFGGNSRDRQWRADHWSHECDECKEARIKAENEKNAQKNREKGLPLLVGSEKQIAWAETIRAEFIKNLDDDAKKERVKRLYAEELVEELNEETLEYLSSLDKDGQEDFFIKKFDYAFGQIILTNPKASFWIDNRGEFFYGLVDLLIAIPTEVQKVQKSIEEDMQKEAEIEATVRPEIAVSETVAIISVEKLTKITVTFDEKRDDFRKIIKGHGFSWGDGRWYRNINTINGSVADRVAEVGNTLLVENFIIRIFDEEMRTKAVEGIYEHEHTRWIQKRTSGKYKGCFAIGWKRYHEDFYEVARKIPTSKWSNPSVVVRPEQFEAVLDFANEYDFRLSQGALEIIEESRRAKEAQLIPTIQKGADAKSANVKQRDFDIDSVDIDYDLKLIREALGDEAVYYSGLLNEKQKEATLDEWRESKRYLVATQASGGFGLTLTEAHYAVFYNNSFSYSKRVQAEDRCHRIGQGEKVTYIDICCSDSIDERILSAVWDKKNVADAFRDEIEKVKDDKSLKRFIKGL